MPQQIKAAKDKMSFYRTVCLKPETAKCVQAMAAREQRSVATMLRILVERGLNASLETSN